MKNITAAIILILCFCATEVMAQEKVEKKMPRMIELDQKEFEQLKKGLGITDAELSRTDVLELIALAYAKTLDGLDERVADIEKRVQKLETDSKKLRVDADELRKDTDKIQKTVDGIDADVTKLFDWSKKVDDSLFNAYTVNGILWKINQLRSDVATDLQAHGNAINNNSSCIDQNSRAIRDLANALRNMR